MIVPAGAISPHRLLIVTGHFGTGKTEFSVNLALALARAGEKVMMADLDIVNPYFRSRERRAVLERAGVRLITSSQDSENADMPMDNMGEGGMDMPMEDMPMEDMPAEGMDMMPEESIFGETGEMPGEDMVPTETVSTEGGVG